ncbi:hypothetical protein [uncultured Chryseobacterium sp.]|uniref:hypothetical protein n=1 Tax=uncultured Chryseobacterium sp. TaxID=259322 RepID=UPI00345C3DEA
MITQKQRSIAIYATALTILAIPLIGMQFTNEINWSGFDFLIAGILLFTTAFVIDFIMTKVKMESKRFLYIAAAVIVLILLWAELAVGIFGSPFAGN